MIMNWLSAINWQHKRKRKHSRVKNWWNSFSNAVNIFILIVILSSKHLLDDDWQKKNKVNLTDSVYRVSQKYLDDFLKMGVASKWVQPCLQNFLYFLSILIYIKLIWIFGGHSFNFSFVHGLTVPKYWRP